MIACRSKPNLEGGAILKILIFFFHINPCSEKSEDVDAILHILFCIWINQFETLEQEFWKTNKVHNEEWMVLWAKDGELILH